MATECDSSATPPRPPSCGLFPVRSCVCAGCQNRTAVQCASLKGEPMTVDTQTVDPAIKSILKILQSSFWTHGDFLISTGIGLLGVVLSGLAFREAYRAK